MRSPGGPLSAFGTVGFVLTRTPATDPDATFTPNQLSQHLRRISGGASPIGPKRIRVEIHAGEMKASLVGSWYRIRWGDFLDYLERKRVQPEPSVKDRVDQRVDAQLRRESRVR